MVRKKMRTCDECHGTYYQCDKCAKEDKEEKENEPCWIAQTQGKYIKESECGMKSTSLKADFCNKCGKTVNY